MQAGGASIAASTGSGEAAPSWILPKQAGTAGWFSGRPLAPTRTSRFAALTAWLRCRECGGLGEVRCEHEA